MDEDELRRDLRTKLAVSQLKARRALATGRRRLKQGIANGSVPVTPAGTVPTSFLRRVLGIDDEGGPQAA